MGGELNQPGVEILQEFVTASPSFVIPSLMACAIGPCYRIIDAFDDQGAVNPDARSLNVDKLGTSEQYQYDGEIYESGTATAGGHTTLTNSAKTWPYQMLESEAGDTGGEHTTTKMSDAAATWSNDDYNGNFIRFLSGANEGEVREILDTVARVDVVPGYLTWTEALDNVPLDGDEYEILNTQEMVDDGDLSGKYVVTTGGTGAGQMREIVSNTETQLTVAAWTVNPDVGTTYIIGDAQDFLYPSKEDADQIEDYTSVIVYMRVGTSTPWLIPSYWYLKGATITREVEGDEVPVVRVGPGLIPTNLVSGVLVQWEGLRTDAASELIYAEGLADIQSKVPPVSPRNPLAWAMYNEYLNAPTQRISGIGVDDTDAETAPMGTPEAYARTLDTLMTEEVYALSVLTRDTLVHQMLNTHVTAASDPEEKRERIGLINPLYPTKTDDLVIVQSDEGFLDTSFYYATDLRDTVDYLAELLLVSTDEFPNGITDPTEVLDRLVVRLGPDYDVDYPISVINQYSMQVDWSEVTTPPAYADHGDATAGSSTTQVVDSTKTGWTSNLYNGYFVHFTNGANEGEVREILTTASTTITFAELPHTVGTGDDYEIWSPTTYNHPIAELPGLGDGVSGPDGYQFVLLGESVTNLDGSLDKDKIADTIAAWGSAYRNRRLFMVIPDWVGQSVEGVVSKIEGWYLCSAIAGMIAGQPPQQGFTNYPITGFSSVQKLTSKFFTNRQMNRMAAGGTYIVLQDVDGAPLYCRHQLSTDTTTIEKREQSITRCVDYSAKFFRTLLTPYIGIFNITKPFIDNLSIIIQGAINYLVENGVLIGATLASISQDTDSPDTLNIEIDEDVPYPCNYIKVRLVI